MAASSISTSPIAHGASSVRPTARPARASRRERSGPTWVRPRALRGACRARGSSGSMSPTSRSSRG
eukprot:4655721-Alexandrium_andersonii.AAC.1